MIINNMKSVLIIFCSFLIAICTFTICLEGAKKCERTFSKAQMVDTSLDKKAPWKKRLNEINETLKNIEKKIKDPNSDIYKELKKNDCVTNALQNFFEPEIDDIDDCQQILRDKSQPLKIKVTVSDKMHPSDEENNPNTPKTYAEVIKKLNVQPR